MNAARRDEYIAKLPPELRAMLDAELAAGNAVVDVELGRGSDEGKIAVILNHPFRCPRSAAPANVSYREIRDRDPEIFEFHTADERFSLVTAKFKPMKLTPLGPGPPNPTEAHVEFMKKRQAEEEATAKKRSEAHAEKTAAAAQLRARPAPRDGTPTANKSADDALSRFLASMTIDYEKWHDGVGYDLGALSELSPAELKPVERMLLLRQPRDWRDIQALAQIDSPEARAAVEAALKSNDTMIRQTAMDYAGDKVDPADRERLLIKSLENDVIYGGLTQAIDEVPDFHPPMVIDALFRGALRREGGVAVHFAALLMFLHGKAKEPFDWDHRPFFLRFHTEDREARRAVFAELCEKVGVDPKKYRG